jgi:hypothetical protein
LCPVTHPNLCGLDACFDSSQFTCSEDGELIPNAQIIHSAVRDGTWENNAGEMGDMGYVCNDIFVGALAYDPNYHVCTEESVLCPINHKSCNNACFMESAYQCIDGHLYPREQATETTENKYENEAEMMMGYDYNAHGAAFRDLAQINLAQDKNMIMNEFDVNTNCPTGK